MRQGPRPTNGEPVPEPVDFDALAKEVLASGLFVVDKDTDAQNQGVPEFSRLPVYALDVPYSNGPMVIHKFKEDVPEKTMISVRSNFIQANRVLLPTEKVLSYFHHSFAGGAVFKNPALAKLVETFAPQKSSFENQNEKFAFQTEVERKVENRNVFTNSEIEYAQAFNTKNPEAAFTIMLFQTVIQGYLVSLRRALVDQSARHGTPLSDRQLKDFDKVVTQWTSANFTNELVPAIALFTRNADIPEQGETINRDIFQKALNFIIVNGSFKNFIHVPAHVAGDGIERTQRFMCPALEKIRNLLLDGSLFEQIYQITKKINASPGSPIAPHLATIASK